METTPLLLVGAGPFGLALAAYLNDHTIEFRHVGASMDYWKNNMPKGMYLRSASDWHLDPSGQATLLNYEKSLNLRPEDAEPLSLDFYLGYTDWFQKQKGIAAEALRVSKIDREEGQFKVTFEGGETIRAGKVVLTVGLRYYKNVPEPYASLFPAGQAHHTAELVDFAGLKGKRVLIIGGRQSAFEWAVLIREAGAREAHLVYRHDTPAFTPSDWTWVNPLLDAMVENPGWFRNLPQEEKDAVAKRMWAEGRLKLEPWLAERIQQPNIHLHPHATANACESLPGESLQVTLSDGARIEVDEVILATGYKVETGHLPMIANGNLASDLQTRNGFPVLDETFQTNIPGLYISGFSAAQDFGPFFGFTAAARTSAKILGRALG